MSRVGKSPIALPSGVKVENDNGVVTVSGPMGILKFTLGQGVAVAVDEGKLLVSLSEESSSSAIRGTTRAILQNMVNGVAKGYERKLELVGVGYRAAAKGDTVSLSLGFSHPVEFPLPAGVTAATPSQTEIVLKSIDKQLLGQVAAKIRGFRPPEPYKGKGVRYAGEVVKQKEAKKK
jgi:large subunit ribosomal protein L6